ncbi:hypothetical protein [Thalassotalea fusca]
MNKYNLAVCLMVSSQLLACQAKPNSSQPAQENQVSESESITKEQVLDDKPVTDEKKPMNNVQHWSQAKVEYIGLEGGFYGIITNNGQKLLPANLSKELRQDGAIVELSGYFEQGVITFQQWGKPFKITSIKLLKEGRSTPKSEL